MNVVYDNAIVKPCENGSFVHSHRSHIYDRQNNQLQVSGWSGKEITVENFSKKVVIAWTTPQESQKPEKSQIEERRR